MSFEVIDRLKDYIKPPHQKKKVEAEIVNVINKKDGNQYFDIEPIWNIKPQPDIFMIYNGRTDGKTYTTLLKCIKDIVIPQNKTIVYMRRYESTVRGSAVEDLFTKMVMNGDIEKATNGQWNNIKYFAKKFTFIKVDENGGVVTDDHFFCKTCGLDLKIEVNKGGGYGNVGAIIFDEFIAYEESYLYNELFKYKNAISTITRGSQVPIFFLGNTVDASCPYFRHFGVYNAGKSQKQGTIDIYHLTRNNGKKFVIAVDYSKPSEQSKKNAELLAFDDESEDVKMMSSGSWYDGDYELLPFKYPQNAVKLKVYIEYFDDTIQVNLVSYNKMVFLYCNRKEYPVRDRDKEIIYTTYYDPRPNIKQDMRKPQDKLDAMLLKYFLDGNVYYQDDSVGKAVKDYFEYYKMKKRSSI